MGKKQNLIGKRYGRLIVVSFSRQSHSGSYWICRCDCGTTTEVIINHLNNGHVKSCGCLNKESVKERMTKHGLYNTPEYRSWISMRSRCNNPNNISFRNYGGRGIKVCKRWNNSFEAFISDMGIKPFRGASIERIDNEVGYIPSNCRWASRVEQNNNSRHNVIIEIDGTTRPLREWLKMYKISYPTYHYRVKNGWEKIDAITKSIRKHI